jgi:hypothetical protein
LTDPEAAARIEGALSPAPAGPDLRVLAVLQRDGRLVDFLLEDIDGLSDPMIGAAVRDIHRDCRNVLRNYLTLEPVISSPEGEPITVPTGFDAAEIRLTGNVFGSPPFKGILKHPGWRVKSAHLPTLPATRNQTAVLAPAEVELA